MKRKLYRTFSKDDETLLISKQFTLTAHDVKKTIPLPRGKTKTSLIPANSRASRVFKFENFPMLNGDRGNVLISITVKRTQSDDARRSYMVVETNHKLRDGKGKATFPTLNEALSHIDTRIGFYIGFCELT